MYRGMNILCLLLFFMLHMESLSTNINENKFSEHEILIAPISTFHTFPNIFIEWSLLKQDTRLLVLIINYPKLKEIISNNIYGNLQSVNSENTIVYSTNIHAYNITTTSTYEYIITRQQSSVYNYNCQIGPFSSTNIDDKHDLVIIEFNIPYKNIHNSESGIPVSNLKDPLIDEPDQIEFYMEVRIIKKIGKEVGIIIDRNTCQVVERNVKRKIETFKSLNAYREIFGYLKGRVIDISKGNLVTEDEYISEANEECYDTLDYNSSLSSSEEENDDGK